MEIIKIIVLLKIYKYVEENIWFMIVSDLDLELSWLVVMMVVV